MNKYTIYCTGEQTRKALVLGAPIETYIHVEPAYSMANGCLPYPEEIEMLKNYSGADDWIYLRMW